MPVSTQLLRPFNFLWVLASLLLALLFNAAPWNISEWNFPPDLVALLLLYWGLNQPFHVGFFLAFVMGILVDTITGNALGAHSLAYCAAMYGVLSLRRQMKLYPFWQQALVVWALMLVIQIINLIINVTLLSGMLYHWGYFLASFTTAILWTPLSNIMLFLQRRPHRSMR